MMRKRRQRSGAAAVEFAMVAPIIFLMFFAALEFSRLNMIRHTVDVAAYEGARRGVLPGASADAVRDRVDFMLGVIGVQAESVDVQPATINRASQTVTVDITVALDDHTWVPPRFTQGRKVSASCTLTREQF